MWHFVRLLSAGLGLVFLIVSLISTAGADTLYVSVQNPNTQADGTVDQVAPGGMVSTFVSGLRIPSGLAFDPNGNLYASYVPGPASAAIDKISASGSVTPFVSQLVNSGYPQGLAFDTEGNLYRGVDGGGLDLITPSGLVSTFGTADGQNIAFDSMGNLFSAATVDEIIFKTSPMGISVQYSTQLSSPFGLAFDQKGDLFASDEKTGTIWEFPPSGTPHIFASLAESVDPFPAGMPVTFYGLAFDNSGNLYVAETDGMTGAIGVTTGGAITTYATVPGVPIFIADPSVSLIPEPASAALVLGGIILVGRRRR